MSLRFAVMPSSPAHIIVVIGIVIVVVCRGTSSVMSVLRPPRQQRPPCFGPFWEVRVGMEETFDKLVPIAFVVVCFVKPFSQESESVYVDGVDVFK